MPPIFARTSQIEAFEVGSSVGRLEWGEGEYTADDGPAMRDVGDNDSCGCFSSVPI